MNQTERAAKIADLEMFLWDKRSERAAAKKRLDEINKDIDSAQRDLHLLRACDELSAPEVVQP